MIHLNKFKKLTKNSKELKNVKKASIVQWKLINSKNVKRLKKNLSNSEKFETCKIVINYSKELINILKKSNNSK